MSYINTYKYDSSKCHALVYKDTDNKINAHSPSFDIRS